MSCSPNDYYNFNKIAFLVDKWMPITSSLECVFNLLFGNSKTALYALYYLRYNDISAMEFGLYLLRNFNILLVNIYDINNRNNEIKILNMLNNLTNIQIIFAGKKSQNLLPKIKQNIEHLCVIHPSGFNIAQQEYYDFWFLKKIVYNDKSNNFDIKQFIITNK